jgi:hypothetical protein
MPASMQPIANMNIRGDFEIHGVFPPGVDYAALPMIAAKSSSKSQRR